MLAGLAPGHRRLLERAIRRQAVGEQREVDLVPVELGAVDAGVAGLAADETRQPPHIPVPSTMIALSETVVGTPYGRVSSLTARIIGTGPTA